MPIDPAKLKASFTQHRAKWVVLGVLVCVLAVLGFRAVIGQMPRGAAAMAVPPSTPTVSVSSADQAELEERVRTSQSLWKTLREARGMPAAETFTFDPAYYTLDPSRQPSTMPAPSVSVSPLTPVTPGESALEKRRRVMGEAARLTLKSTFLGQDPSAVINSIVVHVGDEVEGFRVVSIQAHGVQVSKEGVSLVVEMPGRLPR